MYLHGPHTHTQGKGLQARAHTRVVFIVILSPISSNLSNLYSNEAERFNYDVELAGARRPPSLPRYSLMDL